MNSAISENSLSSSLASFLPAEMTTVHYIAIGFAVVWLVIIILAKFKPDMVSKIPMGDKLAELMAPKKQVCFGGETCVSPEPDTEEEQTL